MRRHLVSGAITLALLGMLPAGGSAQGGSLGSVNATGPVLVDGQSATGSAGVGGTTRVATGNGGSAVIALASGGEVRLGAQSDAIVSRVGDRLTVHLICGDVTVASTAPATIMSASGGRVVAETGEASLVVTGGKNERIRAGKSRDLIGNVALTAGGAGSAVKVMSGRKCDCGCGSAFGGNP